MSVIPDRRWFLLLSLDGIFATFIIGPLVVFYWRGTWSLLNTHLYKDEPWKSAWICVTIGNGGLFLLAMLQVPLKKYVRLESWAWWLLGYHLYTYIASFFSVCHWRGIWLALDHYTGMEQWTYIISLLVGQGMLWLLRSSKMVGAPPLLVAQDRHPDFFLCTSRFERTPSDMEHYVLDHLLTVVVIWNSVVLVWRGFWGLGDVFFFPEDQEKSCWTSLGVGFGVMLLCIPLQMVGNIIYRVSVQKKWPTIVRIVVEDILFLIGNFGVVHHWRGMWLTQDIYLLPEQYDISCWISHGVGIGVLMLLLAGNSNLTRGVVVTGSVPPENGCLFDNFYFRYFLSKQSENKPQESLGNSNCKVNNHDNFCKDIQLAVVEPEITVFTTNTHL